MSREKFIVVTGFLQMSTLKLKLYTTLFEYSGEMRMKSGERPRVGLDFVTILNGILKLNQVLVSKVYCDLSSIGQQEPFGIAE